jgi:hypothetical protein
LNKEYASCSTKENNYESDDSGKTFLHKGEKYWVLSIKYYVWDFRNGEMENGMG